MGGESANETEQTEEKDRQATVLELFLDLAFVFSIAQITTFIAGNETNTGILKGVLLAWLVWWLWTAFTWAGAAVDFQNSAKHRVFVLTMIPAIVLMAIALPNAFTDEAIWFAASYFLVQVWITTLQGLDAWKTLETRKAWLSYGPPALLAPVVLMAGSLVDGNARIITWALVAVMNIGSAFLGAKGPKDPKQHRQWTINSAHFTERHSLFMIIVLGEVVVAIGAKATGVVEKTGLSFELAFGVVLATSIACMYWWSYFSYIPKVLEHALKTSPPHLKGKSARDLFSFGLFPIVIALIFYAVVAKHFIVHPFEKLSLKDLILLAISGAGFYTAILANQYRLVKYISKERLTGLLAILAICFVGQYVDGWITISLFSATLCIVSIVLWRAFMNSEINKEISDS